MEHKLTNDKKIYLEKKLAYAEGLYRGSFLALPEGVKKDPYDIRYVAFRLDEKTIQELMQRISWQIEFYDSISNSKDVKTYGNLINALKVVRGELYNAILHLNEDEESTENLASL